MAEITGRDPLIGQSATAVPHSVLCLPSRQERYGSAYVVLPTHPAKILAQGHGQPPAQRTSDQGRAPPISH